MNAASAAAAQNMHRQPLPGREFRMLVNHPGNCNRFSRAAFSGGLFPACKGPPELLGLKAFCEGG
jgi:hypothetical protein